MDRPLKLNLGSGRNPLPGFLNVDKFGAPDLRCDLERFPWPWPDNSVEEIVLNHVLEHLGESTEIYLGVIKEIYRVCKPDAVVRIAVPHPRCDDFLNDPTHVRAITPESLVLFSKRKNREFEAAGAANSPLALYHDVDFEIIGASYDLNPAWEEKLRKGEIDEAALRQAIVSHNNVVKTVSIELKVIKG